MNVVDRAEQKNLKGRGGSTLSFSPATMISYLLYNVLPQFLTIQAHRNRSGSAANLSAAVSELGTSTQGAACRTHDA